MEILDQSVADMAEVIEGVSLEDARSMLEAEKAGRNRKSALDLIEDHIASLSDTGETVEVTNRSRSVTVHTGDGRRIRPGQSAFVALDVAVLLTEAGLVE